MKSLVALLLALSIVSVTSQASSMTSCGAKLANGDEIMFDLPSFGDQTILLSVGKPFAFRSTSVSVRKEKVSGGLFEKEIALRDGTRFELRFTKSFTDVRDFTLSANLSEVGLRVTDLPIDCVSYW